MVETILTGLRHFHSFFLQEHTYITLMNRKEATEITQEQFSFLLKGIDFWNAHQTLDYRNVS